MKIDWTLFLPYLFVWIITGVIVFNDIAPMIIFIICGGVFGGLIGSKVKEKNCD